jgi:hypothetical protein
MRNYIDAVLCLGKKPARTPAAISEGAISRYDDFVVTHIQQTRTIHFTVRCVRCERYKTNSNRASFSPGTATMYGPTSRRYATSVVMRATYHIRIGRRMKIHENQHFPMAVTPFSLETAYTSLGETPPVFLLMLAASYVSSVLLAEDVSLLALSKSKHDLS